MTLIDKGTAAAAFVGLCNIPVIDLSSIGNSDIRRGIVEKIRDASINVGFFYVKNPNIPHDVIQDAFEMAKCFFALPLQCKMELGNQQTSNFKGYQAILSGNVNPDNSGDFQEGFRFGWESLHKNEQRSSLDESGPMAGANVWPSQIPDFRTKVLTYYHALVELGRSLFPLFALALDLPETFFDNKTRHSAALMKLLHYPPQIFEADDRVVGIGAHTDWECFTILWQQPDIQALQVLNSRNEWVDVAPIPGTFIVNLGDQFARWTNDIFKSAVHRAINSKVVDRYAIPLFFGTDYDVRIEPAPSCVSSEWPARYEVITGGEYVHSRLTAAYH